jgi:hypothetical protein
VLLLLLSRLLLLEVHLLLLLLLLSRLLLLEVLLLWEHKRWR